MCITLHDIALHYFAFHYITYIHDHTCISCTGMQFHIHTDTVTQREKDIERERQYQKKKNFKCKPEYSILGHSQTGLKIDFQAWWF